jgi:hypothetical protein
MLILSIDPGYSHFAFSYFNVYTIRGVYTLYSTIECKLIDIREPCMVENCTVKHNHNCKNSITENIEHVITHNRCFQECDLLIVEFQPQPGFGSLVEASIISKFRHKTCTVFPRTIHKHFKISHLNKQQRILWAINTARQAGIPLPEEEPQHTADTYMFLLFWMNHHKKSKYFDIAPSSLCDSMHLKN